MKKHSHRMQKIVFQILAILLVNSIACSILSPVKAAALPKVVTKEVTLYTTSEPYQIEITNKSKWAKITYSVTNTKIASVDKNGKITPKTKGKTYLTVKIQMNGKVYKKKIKVIVKGPYVNESEVTLCVGEKMKLLMYGLNTDSFVSYDDSIATVSSKGVITARKVGKTTIEIECDNDEIFECYVTVVKNEASTEIKNDTKSDTLKFSTSPDEVPIYSSYKYSVGSTNNKLGVINWSVDNSSIASIDQWGNLTGKKIGKVTITAKDTTYGGSISKQVFIGSNDKDMKITWSDDIKGAVLNSYSGTKYSVTIPSGVKKIASYAFSHRNVGDISIPDSCTIIDEGAFSYCEILRNVTIPYGVEIIRKATFQHCTSLSYVKLPSTVYSIEEKAFEYCVSLCFLEYSSNISWVGEDAFYQCYNLTSAPKNSTYNDVNTGYDGHMHIWDIGTEIQKATCTQYGEILYRCHRCGTTRIVKVDKTNHDWELVENFRYSNDNEEVYDVYQMCKNCGKLYSTTTQRRSHYFGSPVVVAPTESTNGYTKQVCTKCGYEKRYNYVGFETVIQNVSKKVQKMKQEKFLPGQFGDAADVYVNNVIAYLFANQTPKDVTDPKKLRVGDIIYVKPTDPTTLKPKDCLVYEVTSSGVFVTESDLLGDKCIQWGRFIKFTDMVNTTDYTWTFATYY